MQKVSWKVNPIKKQLTQEESINKALSDDMPLVCIRGSIMPEDKRWSCGNARKCYYAAFPQFQRMISGIIERRRHMCGTSPERYLSKLSFLYGLFFDSINFSTDFLHFLKFEGENDQKFIKVAKNGTY